MSSMPEENDPGAEDVGVDVGGTDAVAEQEQGEQAYAEAVEGTPDVVELLEEVRKEEWDESPNGNSAGFRGYRKIMHTDEVSQDDGSVLDTRLTGSRLDSPEGSFSIPDDTPSALVHSLVYFLESKFTKVL
jgi:hypothetical protein